MKAALGVVPPSPDDTPLLKTLRHDVRAFLDDELAAGRFEPNVDAWLTVWDEDFTRALAVRGWVGMTVPIEYGGRQRSYLERFVVTEELVAAGAPVAAHWIADRQIVPSLLKYGSEVQKQKFLPAITRGECFFGIGMSEPDSGSDLASVRTRAVQVDGGWRITGTKVWTSGAHLSHAFICLARTAALDPAHRHAGLSQFIVDLRAPDVQIRPIISMNGEHHYNEVYLDESFVPDDMVFGEIGEGWRQVTSELAFERTGAERFLTTFPVLAETAEQMRLGRLTPDADLGRFVARLAGLHAMSFAIAGALDRRDPVDLVATVAKVLGTALEGDIAEFADLAADASQHPDEYLRLVTQGIMQRPNFTLRGGTNEVLRGVIARELGLR